MNIRRILAASLVAVATVPAFAQEATPDSFAQAQSVTSREAVRQEARVARASGQLDIARDYDVVDRSFVASLSRAEVLADLQIWREAGLHTFGQGEASADTSSVAYRRAVEQYAALRSSPTFAALVQRIAAERGEAALVAQR